MDAISFSYPGGRTKRTDGHTPYIRVCPSGVPSIVLVRLKQPPGQLLALFVPGLSSETGGHPFAKDPTKGAGQRYSSFRQSHSLPSHESCCTILSSRTALGALVKACRWASAFFLLPTLRLIMGRANDAWTSATSTTLNHPLPRNRPDNPKLLLSLLQTLVEGDPGIWELVFLLWVRPKPAKTTAESISNPSSAIPKMKNSRGSFGQIVKKRVYRRKAGRMSIFFLYPPR
jgi:hypothetical protein